MSSNVVQDNNFPANSGELGAVLIDDSCFPERGGRRDDFIYL